MPHRLALIQTFRTYKVCILMQNHTSTYNRQVLLDIKMQRGESWDAHMIPPGTLLDSVFINAWSFHCCKESHKFIF